MSCFRNRTSTAACCFQGLLAVLMVLQQGCAQFVLISYLLGGPPSIEPEFDAETGRSLNGKDNRIAVVVFAPTDLQFEYPKIDVELASAISFRLSSHDIQVIHPDSVRAWLDEHPDWETAEEVGRALGATHVVDIELTGFSLYEANSHTLYRGRAEAYVNVIAMEEGGSSEKIFSTEIDSVFPTQAPRSTEETSFLSFKREYLSRLSEEIGWVFYERYHGDKIPWAS